MRGMNLKNGAPGWAKLIKRNQRLVRLLDNQFYTTIGDMTDARSHFRTLIMFDAAQFQFFARCQPVKSVPAISVTIATADLHNSAAYSHPPFRTDSAPPILAYRGWLPCR